MCGGVHYWEVAGLVSVERGSCSRGGRVWWSTLWEVQRLWSGGLVVPHPICPVFPSAVSFFPPCRHVFPVVIWPQPPPTSSSSRTWRRLPSADS